ncbi:hypothetical protein [Nannocystis pusilla]|uniref:hypothetical protein n=1 Tax=Nannocystis pusilla TaxID=889268 RepID=UPI003B7B34C1
MKARAWYSTWRSRQPSSVNCSSPHWLIVFTRSNRWSSDSMPGRRVNLPSSSRASPASTRFAATKRAKPLTNSSVRKSGVKPSTEPPRS